MGDIQDSIENYEKIIEEVRTMALEGDKPSDILRYLIFDKGVPGKAQLLLVFRNGFNTDLGKVSSIGGWWHDGSGELSDQQVDDFLAPVLKSYIEGAKS